MQFIFLRVSQWLGNIVSNTERYVDLHAFSVTRMNDFWMTFWECLGVIASVQPTKASYLTRGTTSSSAVFADGQDIGSRRADARRPISSVFRRSQAQFRREHAMSRTIRDRNHQHRRRQLMGSRDLLLARLERTRRAVC